MVRPIGAQSFMDPEVQRCPFELEASLKFEMGTPNAGGAITTGGGLAFIAASADDKFSAFDIETGEVLWTTRLPAGGQATPMTYAVDGRQDGRVLRGR